MLWLQASLRGTRFFLVQSAPLERRTLPQRSNRTAMLGGGGAGAQKKSALPACAIRRRRILKSFGVGRRPRAFPGRPAARPPVLPWWRGIKNLFREVAHTGRRREGGVFPGVFPPCGNHALVHGAADLAAAAVWIGKASAAPSPWGVPAPPGGRKFDEISGPTRPTFQTRIPFSPPGHGLSWRRPRQGWSCPPSPPFPCACRRRRRCASC